MNKVIKVIRKNLAKELGSREDAMLESIKHLPESTQATIIKDELTTLSTGDHQLISLITFALEGYRAYFDVQNQTFMFNDTANGYTTCHYISFADMVMLHNEPTMLPEVTRMLPRVFLQRRSGEVLALKHRLKLS
jgi:hypothetical protein